MGLCAYHGYEPIEAVSTRAGSEALLAAATVVLPQAIGTFASIDKRWLPMVYLLTVFLAVLAVASSRQHRLVNHSFAAQQADANALRLQLRQIRDAHRPVRTRHVLERGARFYVLNDRNGDGRGELGSGALPVWMYLDVDFDVLQVMPVDAAGSATCAARFSPRRMQQALKASRPCNTITPSSARAARLSPLSRTIHLSRTSNSPSSPSTCEDVFALTPPPLNAPRLVTTDPLLPTSGLGDDGKRTQSSELRSRRSLAFSDPESRRSQSTSTALSPSPACLGEQLTTRGAATLCASLATPSATTRTSSISMGRISCQMTLHPCSVARVSFAGLRPSKAGAWTLVSHAYPSGAPLWAGSRGGGSPASHNSSSAQEIDSLYPWRCITFYFNGIADRGADQLASAQLTVCAESDEQAVETFLAVQEWLHQHGQLADQISPGSLYWARVRLRLAIRSKLTGAHPAQMLARAFLHAALQRDPPRPLRRRAVELAIRVHRLLLKSMGTIGSVALGGALAFFEVGSRVLNRTWTWSRPLVGRQRPVCADSHSQATPPAAASHVVYRL